MQSTDRPLVSVIVPCYKVERYLPCCIGSVISQTYDNWELVLVDDGSPDRSGEICEEYAAKDRRIKVLHKENGGLSDARNVGLEAAAGDFVAFLDSDDFWHKEHLRLMMELQQQYDADIVQCKWTRGNSTEFPKIRITREAVCVTGPSAMAGGLFDVLMWGKVYRKSILDGIRMPVGLIHEDDWTSWKICWRAKRFVSSRNKLYYYTFNQQGISAAASRALDLRFWGAFEEKRNFFREHGEDACAVWNLAKWNKSIILCFRIGGASEDQRNVMMRQFRKNYKELCGYKQFKRMTRFYFRVFMAMPMVLSNLSEALRNLKRDWKIRRYNKA